MIALWWILLMVTVLFVLYAAIYGKEPPFARMIGALVGIAIMAPLLYWSYLYLTSK